MAMPLTEARDKALTIGTKRVPLVLGAHLLAYGSLWAAALAAGGSRAPEHVLLSAALGTVLVALSVIDLVSLRLPDWLTLPLLLLGLFATAELSGHTAAGLNSIAAFLGYALLASVAALYRQSRGKDGLGLGDAKLFAASGAWVGVDGLAPILLAASLAMLVLIGAANMLGGGPRSGTRIPFGPGLAAAAWLVWHFRPFY